MSHEHAHTHDHDHGHSHGSGGPAKDEALLRYMLEHNRSHARELRETGQRLEHAGAVEAAALVYDAASHLDSGNAHLADALEIIGRNGGEGGRQ
ncbi:MAG: hypothetical protein LBC21_02155 [Oscillospiraceae bacterium]|nr:hypothetical protein [Oscillospiraceae bacterium]